MTAPMEDVLQDIQKVRSRLVNGCLYAEAVLALPFVAVTVLRSIQTEWSYAAYFYIGLYLLVLLSTVLVRRLSFGVRSSLLLGTLLSAAIASLISLGLLGAGLIILFTFCVLATILFGTRTGIAATLLSLAILAALSVFVRTGVIYFDFDVESFATSLTAWLTKLPLIALFAGVVVVTLGSMHQHLVEAVRALSARTAEQIEVNERLEAEITERKRAEKELREQGSFLKAIIQNATEGLCVCHEVEEFPHVKFTVWNHQMTKTTGYTIEEINRLGWYQTVYPDPDVQARAIERMCRMHEGEDLRSEEWKITCKNGEKRVLSISSSVLETTDGIPNVLALMHDVTERRKAEEALKESEVRNRAIVDAIPDLVLRQKADGTFLDVAAPSSDMLAIPADQVVGRRMQDLRLPPEFVAKSEWSLREALDTGTIQHWEYQLEVAQGVRFFEARIAPSGKDEVFTIVRDITERKEAETERKNLEAQIQHAQKLESLGVLAGGIAHDFNNLLTSILGNADLALMKLSPESPALDFVQQIQSATIRAADLTKQMLAYSGKGRFVVQPLNLNNLVEEMAHLLKVSISKSVVLKLDLQSNIPPIEADATQVRQVVMNLITNASEAIGDRSGVITLGTSVVEVDRAYLLGAYLDDNFPEGYYVCVEVSDTGEGMSEQTKARLFDPFFSTKFTGRGLGLAAALGIVRGHKGAIKVYSDPGKGTTFSILFPASGELAEPSLEISDALQDWRGSGTVLVADDEEGVRAIAKRMLEQFGFEVLSANDGSEAVQAFVDHSEKIVLTLLDMTMPHMDGEAAFREIRRVSPEVPVILMSGYNEPQATHRFEGKGLAGFVQKPFHLQQLIGKVREVLEG